MKKIILSFILMVLVVSYQLSAQVDCVPNTIKLNNVKNYCSGKAAESGGTYSWSPTPASGGNIK
jgi:hypothetical protein